MSEKKVVARTTAIGLAVLCVVILIGAIGAVVYYNQAINNKNTLYVNLQSQNSAYVNDHSHTNEDYENLKGNYTAAENQLSTNNDQSTVSQLQSQMDNLNSQVSSLTSQLATANSQITSLTTQVNALNANVNLQDSSVLANDQTYAQTASSYSTVTFSATYSGYVSVNVQSSSVSGTWVEVSYSSYGINYNQAYTGSQAIHAGNSAVFPIMPSTSVTVGIGNGLSSGSATEVVTITYVY